MELTENTLSVLKNWNKSEYLDKTRKRYQDN